MSRSRVGIVTLIHANNYGAMLQAYALSRVIEDLGYEHFFVEISQEPVGFAKYLLYPRASFQKFQAIESPVVKVLSRLRKIFRNGSGDGANAHSIIFDNFRLQYLNITGCNSDYGLLDETSAQPLAYVTGSDCVWAADVFFRKPDYLLEFAPSSVKRISYAASFGKGKLEYYQRPIFRECLAKFDGISVRELSGAQLARSLTDQKVVRVLDPTFLIEEYDEILDEELVPDEPYVLVYMLPPSIRVKDKTESVINEVSESLGMKTIRVCPEGGLGDEFSSNIHPTPGQFVSLIKSAMYVVTNSFHGTVFSIIFEKQFVTIFRDESISKKNLRMLELLELVELEERFFGARTSEVEVSNALQTRIAFEKAKAIISEEVNRSREFLCTSIRGG